MAFSPVPDSSPTTVGQALSYLVKQPRAALIAHWNWKSALFSALFRGLIFFTTNLSAGLGAATGAMFAEFAYRSVTSGFYGSMIQTMRRVEPAWHSVVVTMIGLPIMAHTIEFLVHWLRGTPKLGRSIAVSLCFTALSTLFNLYAMRKGTMVVGAGARSLAEDMKSIPSVVGGFLMVIPLALYRRAFR